MSDMHLITGYAGVEHITSADQGSFNAALLGSGQFVLERGQQFFATAITNNLIRVHDGDLLMQGRHARLKIGTHSDLEIDTGTNGYKRHDLIVARYTKNPDNDVESVNLIVIQGTISTGTPDDPNYNSNDISEGVALINDMPLYRIVLDGINIIGIEKMFKTVPTLDSFQEYLEQNLTQKVDDAIEELKSTIDKSDMIIRAGQTVDLIPFDSSNERTYDYDSDRIVNIDVSLPVAIDTSKYKRIGIEIITNGILLVGAQSTTGQLITGDYFAIGNGGVTSVKLASGYLSLNDPSKTSLGYGGYMRFQNFEINCPNNAICGSDEGWIQGEWKNKSTFTLSQRQVPQIITGFRFTRVNQSKYKIMKTFGIKVKIWGWTE